MQYQSLFTVTFHANSDGEAFEIAAQHHETLRRELRQEGADHPSDISFDHLYTNRSNDDLLRQSRHKPVWYPDAMKDQHAP